ncbi:hypothetical protein V6L77_22175 [Pannonibacter sp. Pt2-lr]
MSLPAAASASDQNDAKWLSPTMVNARANMLNPALNYLTFQHMDQMFATRTVAAGSRAAAAVHACFAGGRVHDW